jgi:arsenite methyltransferase
MSLPLPFPLPGHAGERPPRPDYGIDSPQVVRWLALGGMLGIIAGIMLFLWLRPVHPALADLVLNWGLWGGLSCLVTVAGMLWSSKVGKGRAVERMLAAIPWRGDELVLDVGCGRGLVVIAAAKRLTTGKAIGVDIWRTSDQSGNRPEAAWANARAKGVAERIDIRDGDARQLPFEDDTFDVVLSSLVLHNIPGRAGREQALREMVRVLRPGGYLAVLDMVHSSEYTRTLRACGMIDVTRSRPFFLFFAPARIVTARKPPAGSNQVP